MTIERKLLGTTPVSGEVLPEGVSFDGTNDYLSRSSDMTGNADGKTFTLSFWIYPSGAGTHRVISFGGNRLFFTVAANGEYSAGARNSSNSVIFTMGAASGYPYVAFNTWNHVLLSINLANSSERHLYINDGTIPPNFTAYTNQNIDFTNSEMGVGAYTLGSAAYKTKAGRLAHLFLDYTYRNLSTTSNRRLFIDADGKPSSTIPSNPILYLPMTDAATAGSNSGTGGDFTVNGVLATAERGPNQDNCSASTFDGSNDYLSRTSLTGAADGKKVTIHSTFIKTGVDGQTIMSFRPLAGFLYRCEMFIQSSRIQIRLSDSSGSALLTLETASDYIENVFYSIDFSVDLAVADSTRLIVNGTRVTTFPILTLVNGTIGLSTSLYVIGGRTYNGTIYKTGGKIGEFYFDNAYTDLATDNPFWDSDLGKPNSVRKVIADTSVTPLIALPIMGNDAGNNLGSGGDFNVVSGPFTGARGGSEFWARSVERLSSSGNLKRTSIVAPNSKQMSAAFTAKIGASSLGYIIEARNGSSGRLDIVIKAGGGISFNAASTTGAEIVAFNGGMTLAYDTWYNVFICFDTSDVNKRFLFVDNVNQSTSGSGFYGYVIDGQYDLGDSDDIDVLGRIINRDATLSNFYLTQDYIDFSQETNRNAFVDQLGYPVDLTPAIESGDLPDPLIYMKFEDTAAFGINEGTGGNFTLNGTLTAAEDVTPT